MAGFPKNFLWGGASAANQCEGGIFEGEEGLPMWTSARRERIEER